AEAKGLSPEDVRKSSPLLKGTGISALPRFLAVEPQSNTPAASVISSLNAQGYWIAPLVYNSHPYKGDGSMKITPGDFSTTYVGDETDTSPYPDDKLMGISTAAYIRNMSILIRSLATQ